MCYTVKNEKRGVTTTLKSSHSREDLTPLGSNWYSEESKSYSEESVIYSEE